MSFRFSLLPERRTFSRLDCRTFTSQAEQGRNHDLMESLRESVELIANPSNLDASVAEVFGMMIGVECQRSIDPTQQESSSVTAVVGFGGVLSGACLFRCGETAACAIAGRMTGTEIRELDDIVKDAIGEICNMLAGAWKGRVPELAARCGLSVPAVIAGRDYTLHVQAPEFKLHHVYQFSGTSFEVTIICDGIL